LIAPIEEDAITILPSLDKRILRENKQLVQTTQWFSDVESVKRTLIELEYGGRNVTNEINYNAPVGQASVGDGNKFKQENVNLSTLQSEDHKTVLLDAIKKVHVDYAYKMGFDHREQLMAIEQQANKGQLESSLYEKLLPSISAGAGVVSAIVAILGL